MLAALPAAKREEKDEPIPAPEIKRDMKEADLKEDDLEKALPFLTRQEQQATVQAAVQAKGAAKGNRSRGRGRGRGRGRANVKEASQSEEPAMPDSKGGGGKEKWGLHGANQAEPETKKQRKQPQAKKQGKPKAKKQVKPEAKKQVKPEAKKQVKPGARKRPAAACGMAPKIARVPIHNIYKHTALDVYWTRPAVGLKLRHGDQKQALHYPTCVSLHGFP